MAQSLDPFTFMAEAIQEGQLGERFTFFVDDAGVERIAYLGEPPADATPRGPGARGSDAPFPCSDSEAQ
jgi:hypothetical protein